jgi:hypothetical protein
MKKLAKKKLALRSDVIRVLRTELAQVVGGDPPPPIDSDPDTGPPCSDNKSSCGCSGGA